MLADSVNQPGGAGGDPNLVQQISAATSAFISGATPMANDDNITQNTEGVEVLTVDITPQNAANILLIDFSGPAAHTAVAHIRAALFQDSISNALASRPCGTLSAGGRFVLTAIQHEMVAGTTSTITFKIRIGGHASGTIGVNGSSSRLDGGVSNSRLRVMEVKP